MKSVKKKGLATIAMIMLMGFVTAVFAQVPQTHPENNMETQEEQRMNPQEQQQQTLPDPQDQRRTQEKGVFPQEQNQKGDVEYTEEIEVTELPATVSTLLETRYPDSEVNKVYKGNDNSYKVKVKKGDEKSVVFFDANGTFVKEEKVDDKDKKKDW
jgi:hypothetical protein